MPERIVIIGAGPGGYVAAVRAAQLGAEVCLVEKNQVGGACLNWGCIPSKVMKAAADLMGGVGRADQFGLVVKGQVTVDMGRLMDHKSAIVEAQIKGIERLLAHHRVCLMKGTAAIAGPGRLIVMTEGGRGSTVDWDRLIIATGSRPAGISAFPFDGVRILSSDDVFRLRAVPASLVIVGGGAIGCEFACILAALGTRVTLVEALDRLLPVPSVDPDCSAILAREMKKRHIEILLNRTVASVDADGEGLKVSIRPAAVSQREAGTQKTETVACEKLLVCIGRRPDTAGLEPETIGLEPDEQGWIVADDRMQTTVPGVYAIGDALGPSKVMLAHVASAEGMVATENALGGERVMTYRAVPNAIFTSPEVASVGLTEAQAVEKNLAVRTDSVLFRAIGKAQAMGDVAGQVKIVSDLSSGQVLGVHIVGAQATELIAEATLAVQVGCSVKQLADTIHAHPTLSEVVVETALKADDRARHG